MLNNYVKGEKTMINLKELIKDATHMEPSDTDDLEYILQDSVDVGNGYMLIRPNLMVVRYLEQAFRKNVHHVDGQ